MKKKLKNIQHIKMDNGKLHQEDILMRIMREPMDNIFFTVGTKPAESGGILLGPIGSNDITDFFFDVGGTCTHASYSPDCITLSKKLKNEWIPNGLDFKGFCHSHPGRLDHPTEADLRYIRRLLQINDDMDVFYAPIVIPSEFRLRSYAVLKNDPDTALEVRVEIF